MPDLDLLRCRRVVLMVALLAIGLLGGDCDDKDPRRQPQTGLPEITLRLGEQDFTLEIADTPQTRQIGLMHRDSMPADHGMIFVFGEEEVLGFWMRNTRIPLDIVFINAVRQVVSIKQMKPYDLTSTSSDKPALYAIELNAGAAARAKVKVGDRVPIPDDLKAR